MNNPMHPPPHSLAQCVARLSPRSRARYSDLKAMVEDAQALQHAIHDRIVAIEEDYRRIQHHLARAVVPGGDADEAKQLAAELAALSNKLERLENERVKRNAVVANTQQVIARLDDFINAMYSGLPNAIPAPPRGVVVTPQLRDGESVTAAIVRLRDEINRVRGELATVHAAPLPAAEIKAALVAAIDRMAMQGRPRIAVEGTKVVVHWPDVLEFAAPGQALSAPSGGASRLLCWLHHDELIERFTTGITDLQGAIPAAERPARIRDLEAKLFGLEVEEEHWVGVAITDGLEAHRRPDANPWALLGVGLQLEVHAEAAE